MKRFYVGTFFWLAFLVFGLVVAYPTNSLIAQDETEEVAEAEDETTETEEEPPVEDDGEAADEDPAEEPPAEGDDPAVDEDPADEEDEIIIFGIDPTDIDLSDFDWTEFELEAIDESTWGILHCSLHAVISDLFGVPVSVLVSFIWEGVEHTLILDDPSWEEALDDILFWDRLGDLPLPLPINILLCILIAEGVE